MSGRREVETTDYLAFAKRVIRAAGERTGQGDPFDLGELTALRGAVEDAIAMAVTLQHAGGYSWAEIGDGLGTSKQAAQKRYVERATA